MGDIVRAVKRGKFVGWYIRYRDTDGRRKQRASHQPTKELARRYLLEVEGRVARGILGIPEPAPPGPTVAALCERFLAEYTRPQIKNPAKYRGRARTALHRALPLVGDRPADKLQPGDIAKLRDALMQRYAGNSVRLTLAFAGVMGAWAVKNGILPANPFQGIEQPKRQEAIEYLTADEVKALLSAAEQNAAAGDLSDRCLYAMIHFAIHTGLRKGELCALRWRDLDLQTHRLSVLRSFDTTPKANKPRHLRLPDQVIGILTAWQKECPSTAEGLVFPRKRRSGSWGMTRQTGDMLGLPELANRAGLRPIPRLWHTLRHTFASHFVMSGGNILTLQKILGHADIKMTLQYAHLAPDFIGTEMNRLKFQS